MNLAESLTRILESQEIFGHAFYDVFFTRNPQAREFFGDIDMKRQALLLTMALTVIQQYQANKYPTVEQYLKYLGTRHHRIKVPPELYPKWADSMLVALEAFHGKEWSPALAGEWREAIETSVKPMLRGYEERTGV